MRGPLLEAAAMTELYNTLLQLFMAINEANDFFHSYNFPAQSLSLDVLMPFHTQSKTNKTPASSYKGTLPQATIS